jgi:hypothetical protein
MGPWTSLKGAAGSTGEVSVVITPIETGWDAHGRLIHDDEPKPLAFLCDMDPVFTLRFQDGSTVQVTLTLDDDHRFTLTEYTGPATRPVDYRIDL